MFGLFRRTVLLARVPSSSRQIWKTHKQFCTRPAPTAFTLPPLTKDEAAYFTKPVSPANGPFVLNLAKRTRMYWDEYMAKREWFPGMEYTGDELMAELVKKEGCAIPEPGRTFIIAGLFQHIYFANAAPHLPCPPRSQWHMSGHDLLWFTQLAEEEGLTLPADILERVNPFFQQILIYHTLSLDERPYSQGRVIHTLRLTATKRLLPHLQKSNLALSEALGQCLWKVAQNCLNGAVEMPMVGAMAGLLGEEAVFGSKLHRGGY
ncbi:hypothetical protein JCM11641_007781 [Rhodosporidiobolus odoratus]